MNLIKYCWIWWLTKSHNRSYSHNITLKLCIFKFCYYIFAPCFYIFKSHAFKSCTFKFHIYKPFFIFSNIIYLYFNLTFLSSTFSNLMFLSYFLDITFSNLILSTFYNFLTLIPLYLIFVCKIFVLSLPHQL